MGRAQPRKGCRDVGMRQMAPAASYQCMLGKSIFGLKAYDHDRTGLAQGEPTMATTFGL